MKMFLNLIYVQDATLKSAPSLHQGMQISNVYWFDAQPGTRKDEGGWYLLFACYRQKYQLG